MRNRKQYREPEFIKDVQVTAAGAEGNAIAKIDERVVFIPFAAPGDVIDIKIIKSKKSFAEAQILEIKQKSEDRVEPKCEHFGVCGGCKWQHLSYAAQLQFKQQQVIDNIERIGNLSPETIYPIIACEKIFEYRNKLEYTFSAHRWLLPEEIHSDVALQGLPALGFHIPKYFDKVLDIKQCHLQAEPSNVIRLWVKKYALEHDFSFYNTRLHEGFLRNLIIRNTIGRELMVIAVFAQNRKEETETFLNLLRDQFPEITSLWWVVNEKLNDTISDLQIDLFHGKAFLTEYLGESEYRISPVSFFQTNSYQALKLYSKVSEFADFKGHETVYDLYTGTGSIAVFIAKQVVKVVGVEYVESAVEDARMNAKINQAENTSFVAGDLAKVFTDEFVAQHGKPDVIITDPPRAGMHEKVIQQILKLLPEKIVYVSCNPASQARDLQLLSEKYILKSIQPIDMFPHTHHVENIALMVLKESANEI
ncbi:MAG: 23S rRNA (uracil(1939)-C(5))-methyltransferase RlmD [Bacteroidota bacterium]